MDHDPTAEWLKQRRRQVVKRRLYAAIEYRATFSTGEWVPLATHRSPGSEHPEH